MAAADIHVEAMTLGIVRYALFLFLATRRDVPFADVNRLIAIVLQRFGQRDFLVFHIHRTVFDVVGHAGLIGIATGQIRRSGR